MFVTYPTYPLYRTLVDRDPPIRGEDAYALQLGINAVLGSHLVSDGVIGAKTGAKIWAVQRFLRIVEDGKAGQATQTAIAVFILGTTPNLVPRELTFGQLRHESSFWLGNRSPQRPPRPGVTPHIPGGDFDAGVAQMNSEHHDPAEAFNPAQAIPFLVNDTQVAYGKYANKSLFRGSDHSDRRRWALAAGHWNAPAYANWFAGVPNDLKPGPDAAITFEEYMADVTIDLP